MATLLSPGVLVTTNDLSQVTSSSGDSAACFCGDFTKGPVNVPTLISSVSELKETFGKPTKYNYNQWYQAYNFLQYSGELYVVRAADLNGTPTQTSLSYNSNEFVSSYIEYKIKNSEIVNSNDNVVEFGDNIDFKNKTIRFGTDPKTYKILSKENVTIQVNNPEFIQLTNLEVSIPDADFGVEEGQTISYSFTSDGDVTVTSDGAEIDPLAKTIKFTSNGLISVKFVAHKANQRDKTLQADFTVSKIQKPEQPVLASLDIISGNKVEIPITHEDGTSILASIKDDNGNKGSVNVK